jgi:anti-anti-sigma factor
MRGYKTKGLYTTLSLLIVTMSQNYESMDKCSTIALTGDFNTHIDTVNSCVDNSIKEGVHDVRIDLSDVSNLNCKSIGCIVDNYKKINEVNGKFALLNPRRGVMDILLITGVGKFIPVYVGENYY